MLCNTSHGCSLHCLQKISNIHVCIQQNSVYLIKLGTCVHLPLVVGQEPFLPQGSALSDRLFRDVSPILF